MNQTERLELRLTRADLALLDKIRGPSSRSAWIRNQIRRQATLHVSFRYLNDEPS